MYAAIFDYTIKDGKKEEFLRWYESLTPHLKEWLPGFIAQYLVETDAEDTVMSFALFESKEAATTPPSSEAVQKIMVRTAEFAAEGGVSERKIRAVLAHAS